MADLNSAEDKIQKILMRWFCDDPILMNVFCLVNRKADPKQDTIGINVTGTIPTIHYNPNFINAIPLEYLEMIMVNEGFKILLRHCTTRLLDPRQISSLASSITVDELIRDNQKSMWKDDPSIKEVLPTAERYGLEERQCFEEYFRCLYDKGKAIGDQIKETWSTMTSEEKQQLVDQLSKQSEGRSEEGFKEYGKDSGQAIKDYFDPNGTSNDGWGENNIFDADIKNFIYDRKDSSQGWGKFTGNAKGTILAALESSFSYKDVIKRFKKSVTTYKTYPSRLKINRRYDLLLPGHRRDLTTRILFAIDESGSMSDEDLSHGFAVTNNIYKHIQLDYITFDTEVKQVAKDFKKAKSTFVVGGRGGTNPECVFEYAKQSKNHYDGIIIFTDGDFSSDLKEPPYKILWLLHSNFKTVPVNWGMVTTLNRLENIHKW